MPTWRELRDEAEHALIDGGTSADIAATEAGWIAQEVSGRRRAEFVLGSRETAPEVAADRVRQMVRRRVAGEPLQYVLGSWAFLDLDVMVDKRVLIPRPETEVTAQIAIDEAVRLGARRGRVDPFAPTDDSIVIVDLGTGSGVLALALASTLADVQVWATDISADALAVARANLAGAGKVATRIRLMEGDWFGALPGELRGRLRLVVANPPYVAEPEAPGLPADVAEHEPRVALVSGPTGLEAIRHIVEEAPSWLAPDGALVCEITSRRTDEVLECARGAGFPDVRVLPDLTGRDRVLVARR